MSAVTMHHFSGLAAPFVRSKGTVSGGVFTGVQFFLAIYTTSCAVLLFYTTQEVYTKFRIALLVS